MLKVAKSDLEKVLNKVYENYTLVKEIHEMAYSLNSEYKKFWDSHPEETKQKLLRAQTINGLSNGVSKFQENLFHIGTMGASYGLKKLFQIGKPSREERIKMAVTSDDFTEILIALNKVIREVS